MSDSTTNTGAVEALRHALDSWWVTPEADVRGNFWIIHYGRPHSSFKDHDDAHEEMQRLRFEPIAAALKTLAAENARLVIALHDAIVRPKGVVPDTALSFYDPARAQQAHEFAALSPVTQVKTLDS